MKENNNILIIVENLQKQRLLFKYMVYKFEDNLCTYYNGMSDIRIKNKHIKIATPNSNPNGSYDLVIIDSTLEYNKEVYKIGNICSNIMVIDIFDIVEPLIKKTEQDMALRTLNYC